MCLATMAYVYAPCAVHVTIFSTGSKFKLVSNFTELQALTLAAHSYVLLFYHVNHANVPTSTSCNDRLKRGRGLRF